jgi:hypothetical protein
MQMTNKTNGIDMKSTNMKSTHFRIILAGSVAFCLWLGFGLGSDLRSLQAPSDLNTEQGFQAMSLNLQRANILASRRLDRL